MNAELVFGIYKSTLVKIQVSKSGDQLSPELPKIRRMLGMLLGLLTLLLLCTVIFLTAGCAGVSTILSKNSTLPEGRSAVFGKVNVKNGFIEPKWVPFVYQRKTYLRIIGIRFATLDFYDELETAESYFCWALPPGYYAIVDLELNHFYMATNRVNQTNYYINAVFSVPSVGKVIYIGDINISSLEKGSPMHIDDNYEAALGSFRSAYPNVQGELTKSLMKFVKTDRTP